VSRRGDPLVATPVRPRAANQAGTLQRARLGDLLVFAALAVLLFWVPILTGLQFPARNDELVFHLPTVRRFADHFPTFQELRNPNLSFLPLFHGILGFMTRLVGTSEQAVRGLMIPIGLAGIVLYGWLAGCFLGLDWRRAVFALAVFPYFGVTYFTVLTDFPAFLLLLVGLLGQLWYLRTGRGSALLLAAAGGVAAVLVRQNLIFSTAVFVVLLLLAAGRWTPAVEPIRRQQRVRGFHVLVLALPFLAVGLQAYLWKGLLPPLFRNVPGYVDWTPANLLLNVMSLAANTGYYLLPISAALAFQDRTSVGRRAWIAIVVLSLAGALGCLRIQGVNLLGIYGTFRHVLEIVGSRFGHPASLLVLFVSLLSFGWIVRSGWTWLARTPRRDLRPVLVVGTLGCGYLVLGYGLSRLYERHLLPLYALAVLVLLGGTSAAAGRSRLVRAGWTAAILFGLIHSVVYSRSVYWVP
jgi:hypothetical protein